MREGENWVYDLFIFFLRIWWRIIKSFTFIFVYFLRERPRRLKGPQPTRQTSTYTAPGEQWDTYLDLFTALMFFVYGGLVSITGVILLVREMQWGYTQLSAYSIPFVIFLIGAVVGLSSARDIARHYIDRPRNIEPVLQHDLDVIVIYTIRLPHETTWNNEVALFFINQLLYSFPQLLLSITADHNEITWHVSDLVYGFEPSLMEQLVRASYPEAEIDIAVDEAKSVASPFYRYISYYKQQNMFVAPILQVDGFKSFDPLSALTQAMSGLQLGERVSYTLALAGVALDAYKYGERLVTQSTIHPLQFLARGGVADAAGKIISGNDRMDKYEFRDQWILEDKLRSKLYYAYLLVQVDAPELQRVAQILVLADAQMEHFTRAPYNTLSWVERSLETNNLRIETVEQERKSHLFALYQRIVRGEFKKTGQAPPHLVLEPREIAALWHLPHDKFSAPNIGWASGLSEIPIAVAKVNEGIVIGVGKHQGQQAAVRIPPTARTAHLNVIGRTGSGKSTLLHTLIHQDIASGRGVAIIDPHGKLVQDILQSSIPSSRIDDVVLLDIANEAYPPPFNPLGAMGGYTNALRIVGIIERMFSGTEESARMASYLRAALLPLQNDPHATVRDVSRMFMDEVFREERLRSIDDPETTDFWDYQFNHASSAMQRQIAEPIINRVRPFFANPHLYPLLCHPDSLNFREFIRQKKIILISLALDTENVPEQESNLVGAFLMSRLQIAGMRDGSGVPYCIYVDEVQRFVTTSLSEMLSEARKFGISLTLANQYLGQLAGKTLEAVLGNAGATIIFQCSPDDSHNLAAYTKPQFDAQALVGLSRFQAVMKMQVEGQTQGAFNFYTLPPLDVPEDARERVARIRQRSIEQYTPKTRGEVLSWLKERYPRRPTQTTRAQSDEETFYE